MGRSPGDIYEIRIKEPIDPSWSDWFDNFTIIRTESQETKIVGHVQDQAALHGLLEKIRDMNLTLISVIKVVDETIE